MGLTVTSAPQHCHHWLTAYITINGVDCASGMKCECGEALTQDKIENLINDLERQAHFDSKYGLLRNRVSA